jgi:nucleoside triphosphate diphosphatase
MPSSSSDDLVHDPDGGMPRLSRSCAACATPRPAAPGTSSRTSPPSPPTRSRKPTRWPTPSSARPGTSLKGELGDLLLQTVYHAQMAAERAFDFDDVVRGIADKMVARHPHVFGDESRDKTAEQQTRDWEAQKAREASGAGRRARRRGAGAAGADAGGEAAEARGAGGVRLASTDEVIDKIVEEAAELAEAQGRDRATRPRRWAICCSSWRTSPGIWASTPRRRCARPTPSSPAASGFIEARWRSEGRRPEESTSPRWTRSGTRPRRPSARAKDRREAVCASRRRRAKERLSAPSRSPEDI